jgi:hypothetical protein
MREAGKSGTKPKGHNLSVGFAKSLVKPLHVLRGL